MSKQKIEKIDLNNLETLALGSPTTSLLIVADKVNEIILVNSLLPDVELQKRCSKCLNPFEPHHHRHITRDGQFHSGCYKSDVEEKEWEARERLKAPPFDVEEKLEDKNGHKINKKGEVIFDEKCTRCNPQPPHTPVVEGWEDSFREEFIKKFSTLIFNGDTPLAVVGRFIEGKRAGEDYVEKIPTKEVMDWVISSLGNLPKKLEASARAEERQKLRDKIMKLKVELPTPKIHRGVFYATIDEVANHLLSEEEIKSFLN